jgi:hypothetical protein
LARPGAWHRGTGLDAFGIVSHPLRAGCGAEVDRAWFSPCRRVRGGIRACRPVTITRGQRDALYEEMLSDVTRAGDIYVALGKGDGEEARRLWRRFEAELRLLDEIGWSPVEPLERFAIQIPQDLLVRALGHLQERASMTSAASSFTAAASWTKSNSSGSVSAPWNSAPVLRRSAQHEPLGRARDRARLVACDDAADQPLARLGGVRRDDRGERIRGGDRA